MKLAIFDFDGTLFQHDILPFLLKQWKTMGYSKAKYYRVYFSVLVMYIVYKTGMKSKLTREEMRKTAVQKFNLIFEGMREDEVAHFFEDCAAKITPMCNAAVIDAIGKAQNDGFHTVLLSGTYQMLMQSIAEDLGMDTALGTQMNFGGGIVDNTRPLIIVSGALKLDEIKSHFKDQEIDWLNSIAYADSLSDVALLETVGRAVAVDPEPELKAIAMSRGWKIL